MGKMKIHEIAKELDLTSKEVIEKAKSLGLEVKSHLSSVEESVANKILSSFNKKKSASKPKEEKASKKEKADEPVIIRRAETKRTRRKNETNQKRNWFCRKRTK